jgi:lipopolysaccharide/colanic/teichoic acid biosynthesis glycosyltransferase
VNRAADVVIAGTALVVASPLLGIAALVVKLEDRGPVLFKQTRVGQDGTDFELLKLRTMVVGAETMGAGYAVNEADPRITRAGRLLRRLSLDELPQLWNVVRGEMSVISAAGSTSSLASRAGLRSTAVRHSRGPSASSSMSSTSSTTRRCST